jgi:B12 binding domain/Radical SAM superfamily
MTITKRNINSPSKKRILLTGVFGPFGVDDDYGRKENIMELFHNQVTKGQGASSFRFHHRSFGLYFIAANLDADVCVLDFPAQKRFIKEIKKGYDVVGISFIATNFVKAKEMCRLVKKYAPDSTIVVGGHGAAIEGVEDLMECDHAVKGEGISWMRRFIGQDTTGPIIHPSLPSTERQSIWGVPLPGPAASILVPGVGCVNACSFCSTSHFFGKRYSSFIESGRELFETASRIADERGTDTFFIMDENFLKDKDRALELIDEMERNNRFFMFHVFSSAETIKEFGIKNLVRLGVNFLWVGFESQTRQSEFAKNQGIDAKKLVKQMRDHGITVLSSGILCMEHHTPKNMHKDIDFLVELNADMVQFMLLTPLPVTALYERHKSMGLIRTDLPFEEWHGQKKLNWKHPAFGENEPEKWIEGAFKKEHSVNSSSMYRVTETAVRGLETLRSMQRKTANILTRIDQLEERARDYGNMLPMIMQRGADETEKQRAKSLHERLVRLLNRPFTKKEKAM